MISFKGKIVQLSTDYVFDGKNGPYVEEDEVFPLSVYGKTKLEAENIVSSHNSDNLIIRGNVLYDNCLSTRASFLNWVVQSLEKKLQLTLLMTR